MKFRLRKSLVRALLASASFVTTAAAQSSTIEWDSRWGAEALLHAPNSAAQVDIATGEGNLLDYSDGHLLPEVQVGVAGKPIGSLSYEGSVFQSYDEITGKTTISADFVTQTADYMAFFEESEPTRNNAVAAFTDGRNSFTGDVWMNVQHASLADQVIGGGHYEGSPTGENVTITSDVYIQIPRIGEIPKIAFKDTVLIEGGLIAPLTGLNIALPQSVIGASRIIAGDNPHLNFTTNSDVYITAGVIELDTQIIGANYISYDTGSHLSGRPESVVNFNGDTHIRVDSTPQYFLMVSNDQEIPRYKSSYPQALITGSHYIDEMSVPEEGDNRLKANHTGNTHIDINLTDPEGDGRSAFNQSVTGSMFVAASSTDTLHQGNTQVRINLNGQALLAEPGQDSSAAISGGLLQVAGHRNEMALLGGGWYTATGAPRSVVQGKTYNQHTIQGNTNIVVENVFNILAEAGDTTAKMAGGSYIMSATAESYDGNFSRGNKGTITGTANLTLDNIKTDKAHDGKSYRGAIQAIGGHIISNAHDYDVVGNNILGGTVLTINDSNVFGEKFDNYTDYAAFIENPFYREYNIIAGGSYIQSEKGRVESSTIGDITVRLSDDNLSDGRSYFDQVVGGSIQEIKNYVDNGTFLKQGDVNVYVGVGADVTTLHAAGASMNGKILSDSTTVHIAEALTESNSFGTWSGDYQKLVHSAETDVYSSTVTGERALNFAFTTGTDTRGASEYFDFLNFDEVKVEYARASADFSTQDLDQLNGRHILEEGATRISGLDSAYGADTNTVSKTGQGTLILGATNGQQKGDTLQLVIEQGTIVLAADSSATTQTNFKTLAIHTGATLNMSAGSNTAGAAAGINGHLHLEGMSTIIADAGRSVSGMGTSMIAGKLTVDAKFMLSLTNMGNVQLGMSETFTLNDGAKLDLGLFNIVLFSNLSYTDPTNVVGIDFLEGMWYGEDAKIAIASDYMVSNFYLGDGDAIMEAGDVFIVWRENGDMLLTSGMPFIIPEPSTATLSLLALAGLMLRRRRKTA